MNGRLRFHSLILLVTAPGVFLLVFSGLQPTRADDKPLPEPQVNEWEQEVRNRLEKDDKLKALAAKHPLVLLYSRRLYAGGDYKQSAYSFIYETFKREENYNDVQLLFDNGGYKKPTFQLNLKQARA